ncbi:MAG: nucleotidyltransferase family protein [Paracoccaceae bacterium]
MRRFPLMLFAAGFGTRMGAMTANRPKPLIEVGGKPLLAHALDPAVEAGCAPIVVNLHYLGEQIAEWLAVRDIALSWERERILDTGGGLRAALPLLGAGPVMTLNSDAVWTGANPLMQLAAAWDDERMDGLLLVLQADRALGHGGKSDFVLDAEGRISRPNGRHGVAYLGAQIIRTEGLQAIPEDVFSLNRLWDVMIGEGRAYGVIHQGGWCDVGHPGGIAEAEAMLANV